MGDDFGDLILEENSRIVEGTRIRVERDEAELLLKSA